MRQRLREMDFIRATAALSIIMIHVTGLYVYSSRVAYYLNQAVRFAVPVFILISGLLLYGSVLTRPGIGGYLEFISKRLKKILFPYLIWTLIYIIYSMRHDLSSILLNKNAFLMGTGKKILFGTGYIHLYFVIIIIQLYLLFPLLKYLMKKWSFPVLAISFAITFVFQAAVYLRLIHVITLRDFIIPYYMFFPTWIFFFVFGMYFAANMEKWKEKLSGKTLLLAAVWLISFFILILDNKYSKTFDSSIKPPIMLYCLTSFLFFHAVFLKFKDSNSIIFKAMDWFSAQSFLIYLSHLLILNLINSTVKYFGYGGLLAGAAGIAVLYFLTTLLTCLLVYIVSKTPIASLLGGVGTKIAKYPDLPAGANIS